MKAIKLYSWPGHIRELQNKIQRATILTDKKNITLLDIFSKEEIKEFNLTTPPSIKSNELKTNLISLDESQTPKMINLMQPSPTITNIPIATESYPVKQKIQIHDNFDLEKEVEKIETEYIKEALLKSSGNLIVAAKLLNLTVRAIRYKIKKYKIHYSQLSEK